MLLVPAIFALLALPCFAQKSKTISNTDYTQVIKLILSDQRLAQRRFLPNEEQQIARLSTENIKPNLIPGKIDGVKIELRNAQQIKADKQNGRRYYAFGKFDFNGAKVTVKLFYYAKNSETDSLIKTSAEYEYRKTAGKWKFVSKKPNAAIE